MDNILKILLGEHQAQIDWECSHEEIPISHMWLGTLCPILDG